jgi:hypothetical protein
MRKSIVVLVSVAVLTAACGGGDDPADEVGSLGTQPSEDAQQAGTDEPDASSEVSAGSDGSGTPDNPTPEASGPLPPDGFRIGNDVWVRTLPITSGQCFVQEGDGVHPFTVWGTLDNDDGQSFAVNYDDDGRFSSEVTSDAMFWVAGSKDGSELTVEHDVATQSISGDGLFYNLHSDEWAYGSFQFTCAGE